MDLNFTMIDDENRESVSGVLLDSIEMTPNRVVIAAYDEEEVVLGAISFLLKNYMYVIDWIYVEPDFRNQGIGKALVDEVIRFTQHAEGQFPLTAQFEYSEDDKEMHDFFLSNPVMETEYSHERYYLKPEDIKNMNAIKKSNIDGIDLKHFFDKPMQEQFSILDMLSNDEEFTVMDYEKWKSECVPELCLCVNVKDNLTNLIFIRELPDGNLELSYLYGKNPKGLLILLNNTVSRIEALFPEAILRFDAVNEESERMAKHLFPDVKPVHIYEAMF